MSIIVRPNFYIPGTVIRSAEVNDDFDTIYNNYNGFIDNTNIAAGAGILLSKLEALASTKIIVGSAGNVPTAVNMTGDATISNTGVVTVLNSDQAETVKIVDDNATNAVMYPVWVTANNGYLPEKVSSAKLSFNPNTGRLTAIAFTGNLTGNVTGNLTGNVTGNLTGAVTINANSSVLNGAVWAFNMAGGTSPFTVVSTTMVANLNADLLDGFHAAAFQAAGTIADHTHTNAAGDGGADLDLGFTQGSIPFRGAAFLEEDNDKLFWDAANFRLGIGTAAPSKDIHIVTAAVAQKTIRLDNGTTNFCDIDLRANGTVAFSASGCTLEFSAVPALVSQGYAHLAANGLSNGGSVYYHNQERSFDNTGSGVATQITLWEFDPADIDSSWPGAKRIAIGVMMQIVSRKTDSDGGGTPGFFTSIASYRWDVGTGFNQDASSNPATMTLAGGALSALVWDVNAGKMRLQGNAAALSSVNVVSYGKIMYAVE